MASGNHTQFNGQRYCPQIANLFKEEWLVQKREEAKLSKQGYEVVLKIVELFFHTTAEAEQKQTHN